VTDQRDEAEAEFEDTDSEATGDQPDADDLDLDLDLAEAGGETAVAAVLAGDQLSYDVAEWSRESRALLDSLLGSSDITHGWQGTTLLVRSDDAVEVDALIDEAQASAARSLDIDQERVVYAVGGWSARTQTTLAQSLAEADIAYQWDENGDLVIYAADEDAVEEIFDGIDTEDEDEGSDDGIVVTETLSRLWEAAGALAHKPKNADAIVAVADTSVEMEALALPFGFEPNVWHTLVDSAVAMRMALENDDPDSQWSDDDLKEGATELRDLLRPYV